MSAEAKMQCIMKLFNDKKITKIHYLELFKLLTAEQIKQFYSILMDTLDSDDDDEEEEFEELG